MYPRRLASVCYVVLIVTLSISSQLYAADAARVEFVWGTAFALSSTGEKRELTKGVSIQAGDTVVSEDARLQLRFTDGGFVSLAPHSEFRVNAYTYNGKPDGSARISMELIKGGLRTISGLIGKTVRSAYEMKTSVATIGIRGTEYTVVYGESVSGTVSAGAIAVCNAGGCLDVLHGQSYFIKDENTKAIFISKAAFLPPPSPVTAERKKVAQLESVPDASDKKGTAAQRPKGDEKALIQYSDSAVFQNASLPKQLGEVSTLAGPGDSLRPLDTKGSGIVNNSSPPLLVDDIKQLNRSLLQGSNSGKGKL